MMLGVVASDRKMPPTGSQGAQDRHGGVLGRHEERGEAMAGCKLSKWRLCVATGLGPIPQIQKKPPKMV